MEYAGSQGRADLENKGAYFLIRKVLASLSRRARNEVKWQCLCEWLCREKGKEGNLCPRMVEYCPFKVSGSNLKHINEDISEFGE